MYVHPAALSSFSFFWLFFHHPSFHQPNLFFFSFLVGGSVVIEPCLIFLPRFSSSFSHSFLPPEHRSLQPRPPLLPSPPVIYFFLTPKSPSPRLWCEFFVLLNELLRVECPVPSLLPLSDCSEIDESFEEASVGLCVGSRCRMA